jgi:branched-chain amino acid transport system substrate-binding protein
MKIAKLVGAGLVGLSMVAGSALAEPVKVGMITTLSGGGSGLGIDVRDGFMLAVKQAGNKDLSVVIEDDARKPATAVQIADKMIQSEKVDILTGIIWSNLAMAVVPNAVAQNKIYISPNAGPSQLAGQGCHPNYFNASFQNDILPEGMGAHANKAGLKKTFIMAPNYPAGRDVLNGYKRFYKGDVAKEVYTKLGQKDYAAEIAQIRASGADSVFVFLPGGMGIAFMKQYAQSGVNIPVMGPAFSFDQGILKAVGQAAVGAMNTSHWSKDLDFPGNKKFVESFQKEYGRLPSLYAVQGFDTASLILSAMSKASIKDTDAFRAAIKEADFDSPRGKLKFGNNQHLIKKIYVREVIKEGDIYTNKVVGVALEEHQDSYAAKCKM